MKLVLILSGVLVSTASAGQSASFDPMEDLVATAKKEINAKSAIESSKNRAQNDPLRKKIEDGFWQFFQGSRQAKPGDTCTAVFWKGDRMISIVGPGDKYNGALLTFIAIESPGGFPRPDDSTTTTKIRVTLKQGADAPVGVTALNRTIGGFADEIAFAVPSVEAALAGIEDKLRFRIDHEGREVFNLEWHSGQAARAVLKRCLSGGKVDGQEVL